MYAFLIWWRKDLQRSRRAHNCCPKPRRDGNFAMSSRMLKILEFMLFYPHVTFKILPEGNRRKEIKNEISVKVFLDVDTVNIN